MISRDPSRIIDIAAAAMKYRATLRAAKATLPSDILPYPYDSLSSFHHLYKLLGPNRDTLVASWSNGHILDLGCGDGDCSFFLESLGYRVLAADNPASNYNRMRAVYALKEMLPASLDIVELDLDDRFSLPARTYSVAFMLGVLYHLKNPFYALAYLGRVVPYAFISTRVIDQSPDGHTLRGLPVAYLVDEMETNSDPTNFWMFSRCGLDRLVQRAGWNIAASMITGSGIPGEPARADADTRAYLFLESRTFPPVRLGQYLLGSGWHDVERDGWRWTMRRFSLRLLVRENTEYSLTLQLVLPASPPAGGDTTLTAWLGGQALEPEILQPGVPQTYVRPISITRVRGTFIDIDFELSTTVVSAGNDRRELGIIVTNVVFEERGG